MGTTPPEIDAAKRINLKRGAHDWNRTSDLLLTKEVLYRLSYVSVECCLLPIVRWSGRRESNPHNQLGRLRFYH